MSRVVWPGSLLAGSLTVLVIGYFYLRSTVPISFSATLVSEGNARFTYATPQRETYSPACGCLEDKSERWRGVTFAARRLQIANVTEASRTAFWLMASEPSVLDWRPTIFRPSIRLLQLSVASGKTLRTSDMYSAFESDSVTIVEDVTLAHEDVFVLVTDQPITVILPGDRPIAAYIPVEDSEISITQHASTFSSSLSNPSIREEYPALTDPSIHLGDPITRTTSLAYPMMDLVGPQTILLTEDSAAVLWSPTQNKALKGNRSTGRRTVTAIFVNSPFSTRISAMPSGEPDHASGTPAIVRNPFRPKFKEPDKPARPLAPDEELGELVSNVVVPADIWPRRKGRFDVTITEPLSTAGYSQLKESLQRSDTVTAHEIRSRFPQLDHKGMSFRYPPIPPVGGFNVFGLLAQLTLRVKSGRIMVGSSSMPIDAPSVVTFKDIRAFTPRRNVVPIPLVVNGSEQSLDFSVEATSELSINDAPVRLQADQSRAVIEYCVVIAAIIQAVAAVIALWARKKER